MLMICDKDNNWLALAKGDNTAAFLGFLKLAKAFSLKLRDLSLANVGSEYLKSKLDPALVSILYLGLK